MAGTRGTEAPAGTWVNVQGNATVGSQANVTLGQCLFHRLNHAAAETAAGGKELGQYSALPTPFPRMTQRQPMESSKVSLCNHSAASHSSLASITLSQLRDLSFYVTSTLRKGGKECTVFQRGNSEVRFSGGGVEWGNSG